MEYIKRYNLLIVFLLASIGLALQYIGGDLKISYEVVQVIENNKIVDKQIFKPNPIQPILGIASGFFITLAISIFISVFILKRVESFEKDRAEAQLNEVRDKINEDVFNSLFKTLVPEEIYDVIKNQIIKSPLVRKNAVWIYDFKPVETGGFELKQTLKSEIHNLGNSVYEKNYGISFRTSGDIAESKLERFICEYKGEKVADLESKENEFGYDGSHNIPLKIPAGEHADITLVFKTIYKGTEVADSYYSSQALINATLIANYPPDYKLSLFGSFSSEMRETSSDTTSSIYELKGAILPGQGMSFHLVKDNAHNKSSQQDALPSASEA